MKVEMYGYWIVNHYGDKGAVSLCGPSGIISNDLEYIRGFCKETRYPDQSYIPCKVSVEVPSELEKCVAKNVISEYGSFINTDDDDTEASQDNEEVAK